MLRKTRLSLAVGAAFGAGLMGAAPQIALAQQQMERVEITGSSIRRTDAETALPVTVLKGEDLIKQGVTTAEQAMQRIAANQSNFGVSQAIGATTGAKAEADIRGLSGPTGVNSNKTLVLLNGRRLANHPLDAAAVDLNAIPFAAVDRIEVLRDGASAIYGTDAIGGVVNFILRRDYQGAEASAEWQAPQQRGGGEIFRANVLGGWGSLAKEGWNIMGAVDWRKQNVLIAADRDFAKTGVLGTTRTDLTNGTSGTSFPGDLNGFEPSGPACNPPTSLPRFTNPDNSGAFNSCRYDFTHDIDIIPENEQITFLARGSFALGKDHTLTGEYLHANNKATSRVAPTPNSYFLPDTSPFYPAGQPSAAVPGFPGTGGIANWRAVPAGKRTSGDDTDNDRLLAELNGTFGGSWDYRTAIGQAKSKVTTDVSRGYLNESIMQAGHLSGAINPFGPQTPAGDAAIAAAQVNADTSHGTSKVTFADFRVTKDIFQMAGGPAAMAIGTEYRKEKSSFEFTDINAELINSLGLDPDADTSGSRNVWALYGEFGFPIMKGLDLTLAARYDNYSDFGSTINPKLGVRYQPMKELLLRGSYNTGFRAPTLYEIYAPRALTFTTDNYDDPVLCPGGNPIAGALPGVTCGQQVLQRNSGPVSIGRPVDALNPEKSHTWTVGFILEPINNVSFGLDYWDLRIKDLIGGVPEQAIFGDPAKYSARFFRCSQIQGASFIPDVCLNYNPGAALVGGINPTDVIAFIDSPNENLGELQTSGIDVSAHWRSAATPYGAWAVGFDGTYVTKYKYQRERGGQFIDALGDYSDNAPVIRWQHVLTLNWMTGPWSVVVANRFKLGYTDQDGINKVGNYSVVDTTLTWTGKNLTLSGGVLNLLGEEPPRSVQVTTFQRGYDPRFTDPRGRVWLLRAGYKFI